MSATTHSLRWREQWLEPPSALAAHRRPPPTCVPAPRYAAVKESAKAAKVAKGRLEVGVAEYKTKRRASISFGCVPQLNQAHLPI